MPAGPRVRTNNAFGVTLNNPLAAGGTTLNSVELAILAEVTSAHAILTLDPLRTFGEPEIVIVTAHAPGAQTATIVRGAYSTIARAHPVGTVWLNGPVTEDVISIVTSTSRPTDPYDGELIYETDTNRYISRIGGSWVGLIPPGVINAYGGAAAPTGWLLCNGAPVSRTTFADLFAVVGIEFGAGNGTTTFNVPNLQDKFALGLGATFSDLGGVGGSATSTAPHTHDLSNHNHGSTTGPSDNTSNTPSPNSTGASSATNTSATGNHFHTGSIGNVLFTFNTSHSHSASGGFASEGPAGGAAAGSIPVNINFNGADHSHNMAHTHDLSNHTHAMKSHTHPTGVPNTNISGASSAALANGNMPPYQIVNHIIKF